MNALCAPLPRHFDDRDDLAESQTIAALEADNRAEARRSFDSALTAGIHAPVWSPSSTGPVGILRTRPLHDVVGLFADEKAVVELLLAAHRGEDVKLRADLILSNVREAHADDCSDAGLVIAKATGATV